MSIDFKLSETPENKTFCFGCHFITPLKSLLPDGYKRLKYIQSDGNQWIDTGVHFMAGDTFSVRFTHVANLNIENKVYGAGIDFMTNISGGRTYYVTLDEYVAYVYHENRHFNPSAIRTLGNIMNETVHIGAEQTYIESYNETTKLHAETEKVATPVGYDSGNNVYLFRDSRESYPFPSVAKIYGVKHTRNGEPLRHFIPCINPNGEYGMYDTVTQAFFGNAGTEGQFTGG